MSFVLDGSRAHGLGAALTVVVLVAACAGDGVAPDASTPGAASPEAGEIDPAGLTWLRARSREAFDAPVELELSLVRGDGSVAWIDRVPVDGQAPASGIGVLAGPARSGRIAVGAHDSGGVATRIRIVDRSGAIREVNVNGTVLSGAIAPDGSELYLVVSGRDLVIERLELDEGGAISPLGAMPPVRQPELMSGLDLLQVTPDGRLLITEVCTRLGACWWHVTDLESGDQRALRPADAGPMVDLSNDTLLARSADCTAGPCPFVLVDLHTGVARGWDPQAHNAALAIREDGSTGFLIDGGGLGAGTGPISMVDPTSMERRVLHAGDGPDAALGLARQGQGEWAPTGWIVAAPPGMNVGETGGPTLIRLRDGFVLELPPPAE